MLLTKNLHSSEDVRRDILPSIQFVIDVFQGLSQQTNMTIDTHSGASIISDEVSLVNILIRINIDLNDPAVTRAATTEMRQLRGVMLPTGRASTDTDLNQRQDSIFVSITDMQEKH